jgi:hypothetical protein
MRPHLRVRRILWILTISTVRVSRCLRYDAAHSRKGFTIHDFIEQSIPIGYASHEQLALKKKCYTTEHMLSPRLCCDAGPRRHPAVCIMIR